MKKIFKIKLFTKKMKSKITALKNISIKKSFKILNQTAKKTLVVVDQDKKLLGTLSSGDLRKALLKGKI